MRKYRLVAKKGEGTFSEVLKAQNVKDGKYHAIKCMKNRFENIDQVNNLREIQALRRLSPHEHIIALEEVLYDQPTGRLALVFELMDANLYELIKGRRQYLNTSLVKSYMWQLMKSLDHMHKKGIFHRDIKPENILIESATEVAKGLKLADLGSCRGIYSKQPYTEYISTRWYRAPECLLTDGYYGPEMDMWGAGCVMFEITSLYPLFPGSNEVDQINRIHKVLGTPSAEKLAKFREKGASHISFNFPPQKGIGIPQLIPQVHPDCVDLIVKLLKYDATERISAREALRHPYFKEIRDAEQSSRGPGQGAANTNAASVGGGGGSGSKAAPAAGGTGGSVTNETPSMKMKNTGGSILAGSSNPQQPPPYKQAASVQNSALPPINGGVQNKAGQMSGQQQMQMMQQQQQQLLPKSNFQGQGGQGQGQGQGQGGQGSNQYQQGNKYPAQQDPHRRKPKKYKNYGPGGAAAAGASYQKKSSDVMQAYGVSAGQAASRADPNAQQNQGGSHRQKYKYGAKK